MKLYSRELLKGTADTLVLSAFAEGEMYGYQVVRELDRRSNGFFQFKEGTLYPILHRLERQSLLVARWESMPNGTERRYYSLTALGRQTLHDRISEWTGFASAVSLVTAGAGA
ncbi:MAG TPA: helix-turn-helix transcriptional regulator [Chloroflexota bacterium]|jgi:PadR family transcriptional regulator PadR|nr:helix-turn-helix transcriptional regulator [Chloroflexota bacterium]